MGPRVLPGALGPGCPLLPGSWMEGLVWVTGKWSLVSGVANEMYDFPCLEGVFLIMAGFVSKTDPRL